MCIKLWLFCTRELGINDPFMNLCQKAHIEKNSNVCSTDSMVGNMIGERFVALSFGESHGKCIGMVVDGCPARIGTYGIRYSVADWISENRVSRSLLHNEKSKIKSK